MIVLKFGGTSVGTAASLYNVKRIVESLTVPAVVVVSALGGLTDRLIATARMAASGDSAYLAELTGIARRHHDLVGEVITPSRSLNTLAAIDPLLQELKRLLDGVSLIADLPERTLDQIVSLGERMSSIIVADMIEGASHHNSLNFIKTEKWFDRNIADTKLTERLIREEFGSDARYPAVTGGFISSDNNTGEITNLGRGGSDYTAALIAAALDADELQIWTDVDGFMTTDPRLVPEARVIPEMSFVESMDLCTFGSKVIYPPTIYPVFHKNIPIRILNTFHPEAEGTYISDRAEDRTAENAKVAGISALKGVCLVTLRGRLEHIMSDVAGRASNALSRKGLTMQRMPADDVCETLSFAIGDKDLHVAIRLLKEEFAPELVDRTVEVIEAVSGLATLAVVGDGIGGRQELSPAIRASLDSHEIRVRACSDRSSETALLFVIDEENVRQALQCLHHELFEES